jgi:hypothetical protein
VRPEGRSADGDDAASAGGDDATTAPTPGRDPGAEADPSSDHELPRDDTTHEPLTGSGIEGFVPFDAGRETWADDPEPFAAAQTLMAYEPEGGEPGQPGGARTADPAATAESDRVAAGRHDDDHASEVLRQMSSLSPKAAEAIAAALNTGASSVTDAGTSDDRPSGFFGTL